MLIPLLDVLYHNEFEHIHKSYLSLKHKTMVFVIKVFFFFVTF